MRLQREDIRDGLNISGISLRQYLCITSSEEHLIFLQRTICSRYLIHNKGIPIEKYRQDTVLPFILSLGLSLLFVVLYSIAYIIHILLCGITVYFWRNSFKLITKLFVYIINICN